MKLKKSAVILSLMIIYGIFINLLPVVWPNYLLNPNQSALGNFISIMIYLLLFLLGMMFKVIESEMTTKQIVFIGVYGPFVALSRIPFSVLPSIQPCSYLIFCGGYVFGSLVGFCVGILTVLISNMILGHGP